MASCDRAAEELQRLQKLKELINPSGSFDPAEELARQNNQRALLRTTRAEQEHIDLTADSEDEEAEEEATQNRRVYLPGCMEIEHRQAGGAMVKKNGMRYFGVGDLGLAPLPREMRSGAGVRGIGKVGGQIKKITDTHATLIVTETRALAWMTANKPKLRRGKKHTIRVKVHLVMPWKTQAQCDRACKHAS